MLKNATAFFFFKVEPKPRVQGKKKHFGRLWNKIKPNLKTVKNDLRKCVSH